MGPIFSAIRVVLASKFATTLWSRLRGGFSVKVTRVTGEAYYRTELSIKLPLSWEKVLWCNLHAKLHFNSAHSNFYRRYYMGKESGDFGGQTSEVHIFQSISYYQRGSNYLLSCIVRGFRKIAKKTTISFMSTRLSVRLHASIRLPLDGFWWNWYLSFFRKCVEKIQVSLKSDKNNGHFTWRRFHIYDNISLNYS